MVKKLSCVSCGSLKRFPHTLTTVIHNIGTSFSFIHFHKTGDQGIKKQEIETKEVVIFLIFVAKIYNFHHGSVQSNDE